MAARQPEPPSSAFGVTLENLGFPGLCPDPGGAPFTVGDLHTCIRDEDSSRADEMRDIEYAH
jgi:hypothetical protein